MGKSDEQSEIATTVPDDGASDFNMSIEGDGDERFTDFDDKAAMPPPPPPAEQVPKRRRTSGASSGATPKQGGRKTEIMAFRRCSICGKDFGPDDMFEKSDKCKEDKRAYDSVVEEAKRQDTAAKDKSRTQWNYVRNLSKSDLAALVATYKIQTPLEGKRASTRPVRPG